MEVKIVLGYTFCDEGKCVTVQWLCKKAIEEGKKPIVIRFSGGPQAAHTINHNGIEHICSSFGSGVLLGVPTMLYDNTYIDPISLVKEYDSLVSKGVEPKIMMSMFNKVITPHDVLAGRSNEKVLKDGTCGMGLYPTFKRYQSKSRIQHTSMFLYYDNGPETILDEALEFYEPDTMYYEEEFLTTCDRLKSIVKMKDATWAKDYDVLIFEGSQGLLLDMDCGFYPNVTPSRVGLNGIESQYLKDAEIYLVTRTYTTRHGNGYEPKYKLNIDLYGKHETNVNNEYQGEFKVGALETTTMNRATERHRIDNYVSQFDCRLNLVVTHMDVVVDGGLFVYEQKYGLNTIAGNIKPSAVLEAITSHLDISFDKVYYNDSIESNVKQML